MPGITIFNTCFLEAVQRGLIGVRCCEIATGAGTRRRRPVEGCALLQG